jgi:hypothetical protein
MVSRAECDKAYRLVGYDAFRIVPYDEMEKKIKDMEQRLGNTITDEQRLMLINARRSNNIACFETDLWTQDDKVQSAFDEVNGAEICSKYRYFPTWRCVLWLKEVVGIHKSEFICSPLVKNSYLYKKLLKTNYCLAKFQDLAINQSELLLPTTVTDPEHVTYMVKPEWLLDSYQDWLQ